MRVILCSEGSCCPAVEINGNEVSIGEEGNVVCLKKNEWNELVSKIKSGQLQPI